MTIKTKITGFAFLVLVAASCKKNKNGDGDPTMAKTKTELITTGTWQLAKVERNIAGAGFTNFDIPPCSKDDRLAFSLNDSFYLRVNTVCLLETDKADKWEFQNNEKILYYLNQPFILDNLNKDSLTITLVEAADSTRSIWVH